MVGLLKFTAVVDVLLHTTWLDTAFIIAFGLTNTVAVIGVPGQPLAVGVMVNVTVTGAFVVFVNAPLILPMPLAAIPVTATVLSLVQLNVVPLTLPLSIMVVIVPAEQMVCEDGVATTFGVGLTNTVAVIGVPGQPLAVGVMVNVTVTGVFVVFVNAPLILPVPLAAIPVTEPVLFLVQLKVVPLTLPLNTIVVIVAAEQMVCDDDVATAFGVGLTKTVAVMGIPGQPLAVGVTVKVTVTGVFVVFVKAPLILPAPLAAIPVAVALLSLVQLYIVPGTMPVSTIGVIVAPEHPVCVDGVATAFGIGLTVTDVPAEGEEEQPKDVTITV